MPHRDLYGRTDKGVHPIRARFTSFLKAEVSFARKGSNHSVAGDVSVGFVDACVSGIKQKRTGQL